MVFIELITVGCARSSNVKENLRGSKDSDRSSSEVNHKSAFPRPPQIPNPKRHNPKSRSPYQVSRSSVIDYERPNTPKATCARMVYTLAVYGLL